MTLLDRLRGRPGRDSGRRGLPGRVPGCQEHHGGGHGRQEGPGRGGHEAKGGALQNVHAARSRKINFRVLATFQSYSVFTRNIEFFGINIS